jgi:hypothetical protein
VIETFSREGITFDGRGSDSGIRSLGLSRQAAASIGFNLVVLIFRKASDAALISAWGGCFEGPAVRVDNVVACPSSVGFFPSLTVPFPVAQAMDRLRHAG